MKVIDFQHLRSDWYAGGDLIARALQRQIRSTDKFTTFVNFPLQWIPIFEWAGSPWRSSTHPDHYIPFFAAMNERQLIEEVNRARQAGQLRSLVELTASCDIVLCETLQRIDALYSLSELHAPKMECASTLALTNWLSYTRPEFRAYEEALNNFRQGSRSAIFLSCGRARPYQNSRTHFRLRKLLSAQGIDIEEHDQIVMTSIGPVPQPLWGHPVVMRYDTGIRDVYRVLILLRRLLHKVRYDVAWDCLSFRPYRDVLQIVGRDGHIKELFRPTTLRTRNIPVYRIHAARRG
jgi:predicted RNA-binding protein